MQSIILTTAAVLFPFWMPLWEKAPIDSKQIDPPSVYAMDEALYPLMRKTLVREDVSMRRRIYTSLAKTALPANRDFLLDFCLKNERNPQLKATIVHLMLKMEPETVPVEKIEPLLKDEAHPVVFEAITLYGMNPQAKASLLVPFLGTPENGFADSALERAAWRAFAQNEKLAEGLGKRAMDFRQASSREIQLLAFRVALAQKNRSAELKKWIDEAMDGTDEMKVALAQDPNPADARIPLKLLKDKNPIVRQALCESKGALKFSEVLLAALRDRAASVRNAALLSLAQADGLESGDMEKIIPLFNDSSPIVASQAEETFVVLAAKGNYPGLLADGLSSGAEHNMRLHSINAVRRIADRTLTAKVASEFSGYDAPEIIAASLDALSVLAGNGEYAEIIKPYAASKSSLVRQMCVRAMGRLQLPGTERTIIGLVGKGSPHNVCAEAYEAMGRFPQPVFIPTLVNCLKSVKSTNPEERAAAAWALGQMHPGNPADMKSLAQACRRLHTQCTVAVIPDIVPLFDDYIVLANAFFSLAVLSKRTGNAEIRKCFDGVAEIYDVNPADLEALAASQAGADVIFPRSELTCSLMRQAKLWLEDKDVSTQQVPTKSLRFPIEPL